jgi:hypothetical protein
MPDLLEPPPTPSRKPYPFSNPDFARQCGVRSVESRKLKAQQAAQQKSELHQLVSTLAAAIPETATNKDPFVTRRLMRVREQLEKLDALASGVKDTKRLKELADATTRLSEQERILAGRPLPGSRRPRENRARVSAGWIELQPALPSTAPVAQVAPTAAPTPTVLEPSKLPGDVTP